jgi:chloramphenicol O-acetyltransferase type A
MRTVDLPAWSRREHYQVYRAFDHPHFGMCANVDLTTFRPFVQQHGVSFTIAVVYLLSRAANAIPEFRYRLRSGGVVEHAIVHPSTTILAKEDAFSFCTFDYVEDFALFAARASEKITYAQEHPTVENVPGKDDMLYMTAIPWVSFTSFMHPLHLDHADSIPRLAWGKFFQDHQSLKMPLSVQCHHALMDGLHMGRFYELVQSHFNAPEVVLAQEG